MHNFRFTGTGTFMPNLVDLRAAFISLRTRTTFTQSTFIKDCYKCYGSKNINRNFRRMASAAHYFTYKVIVILERSIRNKNLIMN